jgi:hypothetical protein
MQLLWMYKERWWSNTVQAPFGRTWIKYEALWKYSTCETIFVVTLIDPLKTGGQGNNSPCYEKK